MPDHFDLLITGAQVVTGATITPATHRGNRWQDRRSPGFGRAATGRRGDRRQRPARAARAHRYARAHAPPRHRRARRLPVGHRRGRRRRHHHVVRDAHCQGAGQQRRRRGAPRGGHDAPGAHRLCALRRRGSREPARHCRPGRGRRGGVQDLPAAAAAHAPRRVLRPVVHRPRGVAGRDGRGRGHRPAALLPLRRHADVPGLAGATGRGRPAARPRPRREPPADRRRGVGRDGAGAGRRVRRPE